MLLELPVSDRAPPASDQINMVPVRSVPFRTHLLKGSQRLKGCRNDSKFLLEFTAGRPPEILRLPDGRPANPKHLDRRSGLLIFGQENLEVTDHDTGSTGITPFRESLVHSGSELHLCASRASLIG